MTQEEQVIAVIEKIRPYIQHDGGDVEFVKLEDDIVTVRMLGACIGCLAIDDTLKLGIEAMIIDEVPGIKEVTLEEPSLDYYFR
jgi:Thioredoxin-like proteins and domains